MSYFYREEHKNYNGDIETESRFFEKHCDISEFTFFGSLKERYDYVRILNFKVLPDESLNSRQKAEKLLKCWGFNFNSRADKTEKEDYIKALIEDLETGRLERDFDRIADFLESIPQDEDENEIFK